MKYPVNIKHLLLGGILHLGVLAFVFASGMFLSVSGLTAMILATCAHLIYLAVYCFYYKIANTAGRRIRTFISRIAPSIALIAIFAVLGVIFKKEKDARNLIEFASRIVAGILLVKRIIKNYKLEISGNIIFPSKKKAIYRLLKVLYHIFLISGIALTVFAKPFIELYFEGFIIAGCVLWFCYIAFSYYCNYSCEIDPALLEEEEVEEVEESAVAYNAHGTSNSNTDGERTVNESDVYRCVRKIADKWSYREEQISAMTQGSIRYSVSVDVSGDRINYSVNGRLSSVSNASEAQTYARSKIEKAAFNIKEETGRELQKLNLPHSYQINVDIGYVE
ncbi:MAG: hypothetical protein K2H30_01995 [Clostridia bacterium]|nr:hypothetical protein [Clostridia bacterium]